ncbi:hypothetical protein Pla175_24230 [Pirellulimonas nuda]|uniref:Uncharacterized protein n=1 Tax=Pirellulimonas nuda TaxID=2528009 RepID=A0A518DC25_9BACT|nr:hypothetical protein Pla175_24230 [Pirellulimonas nuda]
MDIASFRFGSEQASEDGPASAARYLEISAAVLAELGHLCELAEPANRYGRGTLGQLAPEGSELHRREFKGAQDDAFFVSCPNR